jgi:glycosyltransferase involved in cell wall biosynthesis
LRILLVTDSFPPNCGGSGWSTYELARGLRSRGHAVSVVQPRPRQPADGARTYEGFTVDEVAAQAPRVPFVRNYFKNERLWAMLADRLETRLAAEPVDVIHAQHVLTTVPAVEAGRRTATPVVATVRDYWPVCYWSDLIYSHASDALCEACSAGNMRRCLRGRAGMAGVGAWPLVPYMRANLRRKREGLAGAAAVVAVSSVIADDLRARAPELGATRVEQIPNPVDIAGIRMSADARPRPLDGPYALYVGKLEPNKGAGLLVDVAVEAGLRMPLIAVGDGRLRADLERRAANGSGIDLRVQGWLPREQVLAWMRHATLLVFPSKGPESLSRVLLEGAALGVPVAAMDTGGTRDIVIHEQTGLLSSDGAGLARDVRRIAGDPDLARRLAQQATAHVERTFDAAAVLTRIEALYESVRSRSGASRG